MDLDTSAGKPIFVQIAEFVEDAILNNELKIDEQVYSTNELSKLFTINPATARKGLTILIDQSILYKKRGVGMFVCEDAKAIILEKRSHNFFNSYVETMLLEAKKLGLNKNDIVKFIDNFDWR